MGIFGKYDLKKKKYLLTEQRNHSKIQASKQTNKCHVSQTVSNLGSKTNRTNDYAEIIKWAFQVYQAANQAHTNVKITMKSSCAEALPK